MERTSLETTVGAPEPIIRLLLLSVIVVKIRGVLIEEGNLKTGIFLYTVNNSIVGSQIVPALK